MIAATNSPRCANDPGRMIRRVISPKNRSTMLSQEDEVGVKCMWKRGCFSSQARTFGCFVRGVVVENQMDVQHRINFAVDLLEKGEPLLMAMLLLGCGDDFAAEI